MGRHTFVELSDGTTAILEIKTTNYNAKEKWWYSGNETVPAYYESQGRHNLLLDPLDSQCNDQSTAICWGIQEYIY